MERLQEWISAGNDIVWGWPVLILLGGTGIYLTFLLRGIQFRMLGKALRFAFSRKPEPGEQGDITQFQALMTSLAATVGTGNIAGVAGAIAIGGPGALFWMWVTGLIGMATKYGEALLGVKYRVQDDKGEMSGGPMYFLSRGVGGPVGKTLAFLFALFAIIASFGIGNIVQANSVADALRTSFGVDPALSGVVIATLVGLVIIGGIKSIGKFAGFLVPSMLVFYILGALVVVVINWRGIPDMFAHVLQDAFRPTAAAGGFAGATIMMAVRNGVARGVFSNEAGLGSGAIVAAAARTREPVTQALVQMTQTFIDTIVVCTLTGFAILSTGAWTRIDPATGRGFAGAPLTVEAFNTGLPGQTGGIIVAIGLTLFAFSTLLGWSYMGERNVVYLLGRWWVLPYRILFVLGAYIGCWVLRLPDDTGYQLVWGFADLMNGAMAVPNLIGLLLLSGVIVHETKKYFARLRSSENADIATPDP
jgi:alanine or glycine:cation symporter, AGCS family